MKKVKKTDEYSIFQKRSGRYAVRNSEKRLIHGEDKTKVLLAEGLIKLPAPKPAPAQEPAVEEGSEETSET